MEFITNSGRISTLVEKTFLSFKKKLTYKIFLAFFGNQILAKKLGQLSYLDPESLNIKSIYKGLFKFSISLVSNIVDLKEF